MTMWSGSTKSRWLWSPLIGGALLSCKTAKDPVLAEWTTIAPELQPTEPGAQVVLDISDLVAIERANPNLPALGGGIIVGDQILAMGVSGTRRATGDTPVTLDDQWHIGSITKSVTATLTAILIEEGVLSWDTVVTDVFQDETLHEEWSTVSASILSATEREYLSPTLPHSFEVVQPISPPTWSGSTGCFATSFRTLRDPRSTTPTATTSFSVRCSSNSPTPHGRTWFEPTFSSLSICRVRALALPKASSPGATCTANTKALFPCFQVELLRTTLRFLDLQAPST